MNMKNRFSVLLMCLIASAAQAQLLSYHTEYYIKLNNGQALSYFVGPQIQNKSASLPATTTTASASGNLQSTLASAIPKASPVALFATDSLVFTTFNSTDTKQVWVIEFYNTLNHVGASTSTALSLAADYSYENDYFMIKNKANGKYLTRTGKDYGGSIYQLLLSPLSKGGKDQNQHWDVSSVEPSQAGKCRTPLGRSIQLGIKPRFERTDGLQLLLGHKAEATNLPSVFLAQFIDMRAYNFYLTVEPVIKADKIMLRDIEGLCPKILLSGDRDFDTGIKRNLFGNITEEKKIGITISVELYLANYNKEIWAKVHFTAEELGGDHTATVGDWNYKVYECIAGRSIRELVGVTAAYHQFNSNTNETDFQIPQKYTSDLISYYDIIGDTMGNDVSDDDNCNDDTQIKRVKFNPIYVIFNN